MKINKLFISLLAVAGLFTLTIQPVYAHVLKHDGTIGAVLHVNPDDDPIVGQPTNFFFEFKDKDGKFKPEDCDCKVKITAEGQEIYSGNLFENVSNPDLTNASFSFVFPSKNIYKITVTGIPKSSNLFQEFLLTYDIRVARTPDLAVNKAPENKSLNNKTITILAIGITALVVIAYKLTKKRGEVTIL